MPSLAVLIIIKFFCRGVKQSEFYGKEFALFDDGDGQPKSLKAVLKARPDRWDKI